SLNFARELTDPRARQLGLQAVIDQIGKQDKGRAVDLYISLSKEKALNPYRSDLDDLFRRWARSDPENAMDAALRIHQELDRMTGIPHGIEAWAGIDGPAAAAWIARSIPEAGYLKERTYRHLFSGWAEVNPREAGEFALTLKGAEGLPFNDCMLHVLDGWTHHDFSAASRWVDGIADPGTRAEMQALLVERSQRNADREPALEYALRNLGDNPAMMEAINRHTHALAMSDPQAALAWAGENLSDAGHRETFRNHIIDELTRHHPDQAVSFLEQLPSEHEEAERLYHQAADRWARRDPEAAREWLQGLPRGDRLESALLGYAEGWLRDTTQREAVNEWISEFPESPFRDQLIDRQANAHMEIKDIDRSIEIARGIQDPFLREETFEEILGTWYRDEIKAEAAQAFIESTDVISEEVKWRILNYKDGHP
ncbi:MAG: hypothetical protein AAF514_15710, partial [Verrucomicrobiota bacterium]